MVGRLKVEGGCCVSDENFHLTSIVRIAYGYINMYDYQI